MPRLTLLFCLVALATSTLEAQSESPVAKAFFGGITINPGSSDLGVMPFHIRDVDGDGRQDLGIPQSSDPNPVVLDFTLSDPDGVLPTFVTLTLETEDAVAKAFDANGNELGVVSATEPHSVQQITINFSQPIATVQLTATQSYILSVCSGQASTAPPRFIRGDMDGNGGVNIGDGIAILNYLFNGQEASCLSAADVDDSGTANIADAVSVLLYLFQGGVSPADPFPNCGEDMTADNLGCEGLTACPVLSDAVNCADQVRLAQNPSQPIVRLRSGVLAPEPGINLDGILAAANDDSVHFMIQFEEGPIPFDEIEEITMSFVEYLDGGAIGDGPNAPPSTGSTYIVVSGQLDEIQELSGIPEVRWAGPISPILKLAPELQSSDPGFDYPWIINGDGRIGVDVYFHRGIAASERLDVLDNYGAEVLAEIKVARLVQVIIDPSDLMALTQQDQVLYVQPIGIALEPSNDVARSEQTVEPLRDFPYDVTGAGITALIYDSGNVDSGHPDFGGRVIEVESPLEGSSDHATHVAGTVGGSGVHSPSAGGTPFQFQGMAPNVFLRSFSYGQHINPLFDNPGDLLENARRSDPTDIVNMSLGNNVVRNGFNCNQLGVYTAASTVVDAIVLGATDPGEPPATPIPFEKAAGNERQMGAPCGNFGTIGSPATAKNAIVIGSLNPGTNNNLASSSRGPTNDGRLRPDLAATGCHTSTDLGNGYSGKCGTSMAAPVVTGIGALLLEEWRFLRTIDEGVVDPFPPHTLKAILIHTAEDLGLPGPDYAFGYGRPNAQAAVDLLRADFVEEATSGRLIYQSSVDSTFCFVGEFETTGTDDQKFTLVWDDPLPSPAAVRQLVNDLDLVVRDPAGNEHFPLRPDPMNVTVSATEGVDNLNNVEMVIAPGMAGIWEFEVRPTNMGSFSSQAFTVVREPSVTIDSCDAQVRKTVEFTPPWIDGDRDFDGNGPNMQTDVFLEVRDANELWMRMIVDAEETTPDNTRAFGEQEHLVFYDPDVAAISLISPDNDSHSNLSTSYDPDIYDLGFGRLMRSLSYFGDTDGPEAGISTRVRMVTNAIEFNCTSAGATLPKRVIEVDPVHWVPPHIGDGDFDFDGHGPDVEISVILAIAGPFANEIHAVVFMNAEETEPDGTQALGSQNFVIFSHTSQIASIDTPLGGSATYTDVDWQVDRLPGDGCVRELVVTGDTNGSVAGTLTGETIDFAPIRFYEFP